MNKIEPKSIYNFKFKEKLKAELKPEWRQEFLIKLQKEFEK